MRIGFANGCFDVFHPGHRYFLETAKQQCDYLIVAVNSDASVRQLKGKNRPADRWIVRALQVQGYADAVIPFEGNPVPLIAQILPEVIFRGEDQLEEGHMLAPIERIARLPHLSTTAILGGHAHR